MENNITTPVLLLTGYLGSGKTTLLNRILNNRSGIRFAVIVNDLGEVNIDADLIERGGIVGQKDQSLVALQNGCICCTLKMDLIEQLHDIISQHRFDYIVIEASGICEPAPIAQTIVNYEYGIASSGSAKLEADEAIPMLDSIVTVVDALRMRDEFDSGHNLLRPGLAEEDIENLVIQQIEFCNVILLNKASMLSTDELGRVREIVRSLQPKAEIIECDYCDVPLEKLLHTGRFDFDQVASSAAWIDAIEGHHEEDHEDDEDHADHSEHHHHHHHHDEGEAEEYGISTFVYYARPAMDFARFDDFVARHWPKGVIRAKGICWFESEPDICYLFEQAGKQVSLSNAGQWYATMPANELEYMMSHQSDLQRDWLEPYGDRMQKIVFIGQHLDHDAICAALDGCQA